MNRFKSFFYDALIISGLASFGVGLFLLYGVGVTCLSLGVVFLIIGALGHYKGSQ